VKTVVIRLVVRDDRAKELVNYGFKVARRVEALDALRSPCPANVAFDGAELQEINVEDV
jgi:hypothetical protein